jgi:uncharacterized protein (DUF2267 family)
MPVIEEEKQLTLEKILEMPEMSDWHAAIRYAQTTPFSKMFPKKHEMSLSRVITLRVRRAFEENAHTTLKDVVSTILGGLKDDISPELIVKMTQLIVDEWTKLSATIQAQEPVEALV